MDRKAAARAPVLDLDSEGLITVPEPEPEDARLQAHRLFLLGLSLDGGHH